MKFVKRLLFLGLIFGAFVSNAQYPSTITGYSPNAVPVVIPLGNLMPSAYIDAKGAIISDSVLAAAVGLMINTDNGNNLRDVGLIIQNGETAEGEKIGVVILGNYAIQNEVTGNIVNLENSGGGAVKAYFANIKGDTAIGIKATTQGVSLTSSISGAEIYAIADTSLKDTTQALGIGVQAIAGKSIGLSAISEGVSDTLTSSFAIGVNAMASGAAANVAGYFTANPNAGSEDSTVSFGVSGNAKSRLAVGVRGFAEGTSNQVQNSIAYGIYGEAYGASTNYAGYFNGNVYVNGSVFTPMDTLKEASAANIENALGKVMSLKAVTYNSETSNHYALVSKDTKRVFPDMVTKRSISKGNATTNPRMANLRKRGENVEPKTLETETVSSINYLEMIPVLTKAIQEQQELIEQLMVKIETLEQK